jgi:heterotetrameric sarcosine oxidase gamma subunit
VARLIEITPCAGLLPKIAGSMVLSELPFARMTSVAPFKGKSRALGAALKAMGLGWPDPGQSRRSGDAAILWSGMDQAFLIGPDPAPLAGLAALTDQSDGWARIRLKGPGAEAALARLVPLDLRPGVFAEGQVARTGLNHMMLLIARSGPDSFDLMVFRSMAGSAVHELHQSMEAVVARAMIG